MSPVKRQDRSRLLRWGRAFNFHRLHRSEGGNVVVLYIAAALLLIGMLWAIIGTGARVIQKETLQSSVDAAAFSAAVVKAKGMNILAFCNLLMALFLAIIIILRLIKDALILAGVLLSAASIFAWALAPLAAEVDSMSAQFSQVEKEIEDMAMKAMNGVGKLERAINKIVPALSLVEAWRIGTHDAYKANFGSGMLITVALPLPIGKDLSLPTKDGTWVALCDQARDMITRILDSVLSKVVGSTISTWVSKAFGMIAGPFEAAVCGGGEAVASTFQPDQLVTDCSECASGSPSAVKFNCTLKTGGGNELHLTGFPGSADCSGGGFSLDGVEYETCTFISCVLKKDYTASNSNTTFTDKPLPLELADDWQNRTQVRAFTVLTNTNEQQRRQSVAVARSGGASSSPALTTLLTMAQAEYTSFNGHRDLWHMDWRARLVPFTFGGDFNSNDTGDTTGTVSSGALSSVTGAIQGFLNGGVGQTLMGQFLVH